MDGISERRLLETLPDSLRAWSYLPNGKIPEWIPVWESLRPFLLSKGYDLFRSEEWRPPKPNSTAPPSQDSFALYGDRGEGFVEYCQMSPLIMGARDKLNRSVVIKVIAKGQEGNTELDILRLLNNEPLRSDPANSTVPVLEFIELGDWIFAVMPFCGGCDTPAMLNAHECLEFSEQLLSTLAFLHENRIAHRDISWENVLMNHLGKRPKDLMIKGNEPVLEEFRSTFPVRYMVIDFGCSLRFHRDIPLSSCVADPFPKDLGRPYMAMEAACKKHDPFAADVYQAGRLLYSWFYAAADDIPSYYDLLRDMTSIYPPDRPSMAASLDQLRCLRTLVPSAELFKQRVMASPAQWPMIEPPFWKCLHAYYKTGLWHAGYVYLKIKSIIWTGVVLRWVGIPPRFLPGVFRTLLRFDFTVRRGF